MKRIRKDDVPRVLTKVQDAGSHSSMKRRKADSAADSAGKQGGLYH